MEQHAKKEYKSIIPVGHKHFKSNECCLLIDKEYSFLGASPDLVISCACYGKGICEIKARKSIKDQTPSMKNYKHLVKNDRGLSTLSKTSEYYTQIQGQMAIVGVDYCDFLFCFV